MSEDSLLPFELPSVARKKLSVGFDGGQLSSGAGVLVLRGVEKKLGLAARLASCIRDRRKPERRAVPTKHGPQARARPTWRCRSRAMLAVRGRRVVKRRARAVPLATAAGHCTLVADA